MNLDFVKIENKYHALIEIAKDYMVHIDDSEHDINHMIDVVSYMKELLKVLDIDADIEVCIISAYWHDVGRIKGQDGHERLSAEMLKEQMKRMHYDDEFINKCYKAIEYHKWNMHPETVEGIILKDADKLAWLGVRRWKECLSKKKKLDSIVNMLPKLRDEILYFDESRKIFDRDIIIIFKLLYSYF